MKTRFLFRPVPPFRLDLTVWALRRRPGNLIDRWDGQTYRRVIPEERDTFEIAVSEVGEAGRTLSVTINEGPLRGQTAQTVKQRVQRALGVRADLAGFYRLAETDPKLKPLASRFRGLKPPQFFSIYEGLINGIACQQLSLSLGIQLLGRLARRFGPSVGNGESTRFGFPRPSDLATARPEEIRMLGFNFHKARAMVEISRAMVEGRLDLDVLAQANDEEALQRLMELRGVGRWTAEYTLLRGMGRWHIFPVDDQGARNGLALWLQLRKPVDAARAQRILKRWEPYGGLIYFHMLMNGLDQAGHLNKFESEQK